MWIVPSARESARRRSQRSRGNVREELESQCRSGFRNRRTAKERGRYQNKHGGSDHRNRCSVTGTHRAVILSGDTHCVAIVLVLLQITSLTMVHRAISRVAARV